MCRVVGRAIISSTIAAPWLCRGLQRNTLVFLIAFITHHVNNAYVNFELWVVGDRVVVVSHGATIEALYTRARPSEDCRGKVPNASINVLHLFDAEEEWSVKSWGDVTHK